MADIDFNVISHKVEACCRTIQECGECQKGKCLIGYAKIVAKFVLSKNILTIQQGIQFIPTKDYKVYDEELLKQSLIEIIAQCKNCQENHTEDCAINIIRSTIELALLGETIDYKGSTLTYLMDISKLNKNKSNELMELYKTKKNMVS